MSKSKQIIKVILSVPVKIVLRRHKPTVIAITGSAGKTSCKEFLGKLLEQDFDVLTSLEGYNTEIGAPLAFFGEKTPDNIRSIWAWLVVLVRVYARALFSRSFADKVVVEMGADSPGDIRYLASIFRPSVGVVLEVLPVHMAQFSSIEAVAAEKSELVQAISASGRVYLNFDNELVREMDQFSEAPVAYFGADETIPKEGFLADNLQSDIHGLNFDLKLEGQDHHFEAKLYGRHMIYPLLGAISVAYGEGVSIDKLIQVVSKLEPFKGRMNVIEGMNGSLIIDDSYNANPKSTVEALSFLVAQKGRKIALLGTMNELGDYEEEGHRIVGEKAAQSTDLLLTVGKPAERYLLPAAVAAGMPKKNTIAFATAAEAGEYLSGILKSGDIILGKGSQNKVRIERAIEKIMLHPEGKKAILVRQSDFWKNN